MDDVDDFSPALGHIGTAGRSAQPYLSKAVRAARRAGESQGSRKGRFDGSRIGRGAALGRLLGGRDRFAGLRQRRAIVKTRLVQLRGKGLGGARAHLRYLQRDGVQRDGSPGQLYSASDDRAEGASFLERCAPDRHQFRIIISPEDGDQYEDLKPLTRRLMAQVEKDLGTALDWVAVDHVDTGQPHSHIILRGRDELGQNLVIAREYIARGMRERMMDLVTADLGPRLGRDIRARLRLEVNAERLTSLDRSLLRRIEKGRLIAPSNRDPVRHTLESARLRKLGKMGLADRAGGGRWRLADRLEQRLRELGERGDIIRTMQRAMTAGGVTRAPADRIIHDAAPAVPIIGRLLARGLADEVADRHYLLVDGADGRLHHVVLRQGGTVDPLPADAVIKLDVGPSGATRVETLSPVPLDRLARWPGLTWLDRLIDDGEGEGAYRDSGFGRDLRSALAVRRQWLIDQELAGDRDGRLRLAPGVLAALQARDLQYAGAQLAPELDRPFIAALTGERIIGTIERKVDLPSGSYALVANAQEFTLVPWRPVLNRRIGTTVFGLVRDHGVSWEFGRGRDGPSIG